MNDLYDALDDCLEAIGRGASIDAVLRRYPRLSGDLRPLLEAALAASGASRIHVPLDVRRRGRTNLLSAVRDGSSAGAPGRRRVIPLFSRLALTGSLVAALALTSTGLVSASSSSLPGQQLYPVKRSWESVRLLFAFSPQQRELLESDYEQERLDETNHLLSQRQSAPITFSGLLARQADGTWKVSGIPVSVSSITALPQAALSDGAPVSVTGQTRADGIVEAQQIQMLQPGSSLPPLEPSENNEPGSSGSGEEGSGESSQPLSKATPAPAPANPAGTQARPQVYGFTGVVESMQGNQWRVNGQPVYVDTAQISGQIRPGSIVRFQGYYGADGRFIVTIVQPQSGGSTKNQTGGSGGSGGSGGEGEPEDGGGNP
jgi:hypothetical protein